MAILFMPAQSSAGSSEPLYDRTAAPRAPNIIWRALKALVRSQMQARQRQADREIALFVERSGGCLTDHVEREIEHRFLGFRERS